MLIGNPTIRLHPKQAEVFKFRSRFKVVVAGRRWGKALALDTPIPTPSGWTTMGELKTGDLVFDEQGKPCRVLKAHDIMHDRPCYEVVFSDGTKIIADQEHLWETWSHKERKNSRRNPKGGHGPSVRTTQEIANTLTHGSRGDNNHSIQCTEPVQYPKKSLEIDPYLFGLWLGDGDSDSAALTCSAEDLEFTLDQIRQVLNSEPSRVVQDSRTGAFRISLTSGRGCEYDFQRKLKKVGVFCNKHIPTDYLQGSVKQRLALLQGLMDSDGTCNSGAGNCEFTSIKKHLADQFLELATSLGIKATLIEGRATLEGKDCGAKYRVKFSTDLSVFRLPRKLSKLPSKRKFRIDHRFIVEVNSVPSVPVRCITVDSPKSLYLCSKNFVPTHNTQLAKASIISRSVVPRSKIWYVAPSYRMAKMIMWEELKESIPAAWIAKIHETDLAITLKNKTVIECKGADKPDTLRGVGLDFVVLDEFQDFKADTWIKVLRPTLASTQGDALFIGTPKGYANLYDVYVNGIEGAKKKRAWKSWQFPTITSPFIPEEEIKSAREDMDPKSFQQEFEASFENMSGRVYHQFDRKIHVGDYPFNPKLPIWVGQDFNVDPMSTVILQPQPNGELWAVDEIFFHNSNTQEVCEELERRYWRYTNQVIIYPDPAGGNRSSARGESDLDIFREKGFKKIKYRKKHPPVVDRINAVNRMCKDAAGNIRLRVNKKCYNVITSLEQTIYKEGSPEVNKSMGVEHMADAIGYPIEIEFPTRKIKIAGRNL